MKVLLVQGHVGIGAIGTAGLCDGLDKAATVAKLRGSTGSHGEAEWVGTLVGLLRDALLNARAPGLEVHVVDAIYRPEEYATFKPDLVLASHYHRDPQGRAMASRPDPALGFHNAAAQAESQRFVDRWNGGYNARTGIPVTPALVTLNMTQLYTWCFIDSSSAAVIVEYGNADQDAPTLYEPGITHIVSFMRDCILEHLGLPVPVTVPPVRRASDTPPTPPPAPAPRTVADIATDLERLTAELRTKS